jgi:hypothetical protein
LISTPTSEPYTVPHSIKQTPLEVIVLEDYY